MSHLLSQLRNGTSARRLSTSRRHALRVRPELEQLESRELLTGGLVHPNFIINPHPAGLSPLGAPGGGPGGGPTPSGGPAGYGYSPTQIETAYGINQVSFNGTPGNGAGTTIAIVDAYDQPNIARDLHQFDVAFGLPDPPSFTKVSETGGSTSGIPTDPSGWGVEISLDVEWAHAIAPQANILLVEANGADYSDLLTAESYAADYPGVVAVSNSWGGGEFSGETGYDSYFTTPMGHTPVTFLASSGDYGAPPLYPAASPNVLAVGGTTLYLTNNNTIASESGWTGSTGGPSAYEAQPAYQNGTAPPGERADPDVAYDADPNTGFPVYDSNYDPSSPWLQVGGTSDASPQWAAIIAIADQGRALQNLPALDGPSQTLPALYGLQQDLNDITLGGSEGSPPYNCGPGYDYVTGIGTPQANLLIPALVGGGGSGGGGTKSKLTSLSVQAPATVVAGKSFSVTVSALDQNGAVFSTYAGTVQLSSTDPAATFPGPNPYTFNTTDAGTHTFTPVTMYTAGERTITVTDSRDQLVGTATVDVLPAPVASMAFIQQPLDGYAGTVMSPAVSVGLYDQYGNLETADNSDTVSLAIGNNPSNGVLSGTTSMTVSGGVATFSNLSISTPGARYTLVASSPAVASAVPSAAFTIKSLYQPPGNLIEGFENFYSETWYVTGPNTSYSPESYAAHDGAYGLDITGPDWIYRDDPAATVRAGDQISVWVNMSINRGYFGFGAGPNGTLAIVAAPNTNQLMLMYCPNYYTFITLGAVPYSSYVFGDWYRLEVDWSLTGSVTGRLFASNGTTLLTSVTASVASTGITSGGIAFRGTGVDWWFDTVIDNPGLGGGGAGGGMGGPPPAVVQKTNTTTQASTRPAVVQKTNTTAEALSLFSAPFALPANHDTQDFTSVWTAALADYLAAHDKAHRITIPLLSPKTAK